MQTIQHVINRLRTEYKHYSFKPSSGSSITVSTSSQYKDLIAWRMIEKEIKILLTNDEGVKTFDFYPIYEVGIIEWNKDLCYLVVEIDFYEKH